MRPQGVVGALVAIAVGAILTYAVTFTISGISIHTVGVIVMIAGAAALVILLVRAMGGMQRRSQARQAPLPQSPTSSLNPSADMYRQDPFRQTPPVAVTRVSTDVYGAPEPHRVDEQRRIDEQRRAETQRPSAP